MFSHKNKMTSAFVIGAILLMSACKSASFPEITDEYAETSEEGYLKESSGLASDSKNVAYEGETITPAKTTPVIVSDSEDLTKEETVLSENTDDMSIPELDAEDTEPAPEPKKTVQAPKAEPADLPQMPQVPSVTYLVETFYFDNGSSYMPEGAASKIRQIVKEAKKNNAFVRVMGYASSRTRNTDMGSHKLANFKVSQARAEAVAAALKRAGMPSNKILVEAMSDNRPAYLEVMPEGERLNRRAEVYISY